MSSTARREPLLTLPFVRLWSLSFFTFLSAFQLFPTIPFRIIALGGTKAEAGLFLGVYTYAAALCAPLMGTIADHIGRRRLLVGVCAGFVVFSVLYGVITWFPALLVVAVVHGSLWSGMMSASGGVMTDILPESRRTEGLSYWGMASTFAIALAPSLGLFLYGFSWLTLCLTMAGLSVVMIGLAAGVGSSTGSGEPFPRLVEIIDVRVLVTALAMSAISFGYGGVTSYVALLATERGILPVSLYFTVFAGMILASRLSLGPVADRIGTRGLLFPGYVVAPVALAVLAFAMTRVGIVISALLFGFTLGIAFPAFMSFILSHTNPARRAATFGSSLMAFDAGIGTGSTVIGFVIERAGFMPAFLVGAAVSVFAIPIFLFGSKRLVAAHTTRISVLEERPPAI
jgi:MFS family permease